MKTPQDYGLPHDIWNPHQLETIEWAQNISTGVGIVEAPTGSGKSTLPAALSKTEKVIAVVKTKFLQEDNYERGYGFIPLYGRGNYPCVYESAAQGATAAECAFAESGMEKCPQSGLCEYFNQREEAKQSQHTALNYAYWLHVYFKWPAPHVLVCDEGHQLSEVVLEWAGASISEEQRITWDLPYFPMIRSTGSKSVLGESTISAPEERALTWLKEAIRKMISHVQRLQIQAEFDRDARKKLRVAELLSNKLKATFEAMGIAPHDWYIKSGPGVHLDQPITKAFVAKPLTAKHHFRHYFTNEWKLLIMSATIGDPATFASELGLKNYDFLRVPSRWTPAQKPIYALDCPRMGRSSKPTDYAKQADEIANAIKSCSPLWDGIVHTTSMFAAKEMAQSLATRGLSNRVYLAQKGSSTNEMVRQWHERMDRYPGSILCTWALHEGYNGVREKINISAKTPYPSTQDDYDKIRCEYDRGFYNQRTAWTLEQMMGRVRRGPSDYDTKGKRETFNAIADNGWRYVKKYLSEDFSSSIVSL